MDKHKKDLLVFGYGLGLISLVFACMGTRRHGFGLPQQVELAASAIFFSVTAFRWEALGLGYKGWMKVAHLIGGIVTAFFLGVIFFLVFTPVGIVFRLAGKDHLDRRIDKAADSYWYPRTKESFSRERYTRQF